MLISREVYCWVFYFVMMKMDCVSFNRKHLGAATMHSCGLGWSWSLMIVDRGRAKEEWNITRNSSAIRCCFLAVSPILGGSFVMSSKSDGSLLRKGIVLPRIGWERKTPWVGKRDTSRKNCESWSFFRFGSGDDFLRTFHLFWTPNYSEVDSHMIE